MTVAHPSEEPDDSDEDDGASGEPDVNGWWRCVATLLGGAGLTFGTLAIFKTHVEAGPVALLVVGLVFALIAMSGSLPWRIKIGDNEIELRRERTRRKKSEALAVDLAASVDPATQPQAVEVVQRARLTAPQLAFAAESAFGYEQMVTGMIKQIIAGRVPGRYTAPEELIVTADTSKTPSQRPTLFDGAVIRIDGKRRALIEIKATTGDIDLGWINVLHDRFVRGVNQYGAQMLLLITKEPLSRAAGMRIHEFTDMVWVQVSGQHDAVPLEKGIDRVIGKLPHEA